MSVPFKYYFSNERTSGEKRGVHSKEALIKYFTSKGGANSREALFRVNMVFFFSNTRSFSVHGINL